MNRQAMYAIGALLSAALWLGAVTHLIELDQTEVLAFVTGALCVWLTVRRNIWNWPIGIANNVFFVVLFLQSRLFADMTLQVVYVVLGALGWYWWLHGGPDRGELPVARTTAATAGVLAVVLVACTIGMTVILQRIDDSAPFWDALTTVMSLIAQYLLTRKLLENWYVWLAADVIYVALYCSKHLYLTAGLYALFMALCVVGLRQWRASLGVDRHLAIAPHVGVARA